MDALARRRPRRATDDTAPDLAQLRKYAIDHPAVHQRPHDRGLVAYDIAHAQLKERIDRGEGLPQYFRDHMIYYARPAKRPEGRPSGSDLFRSHGGTMVVLAKATARARCARIGSPAARLADHSITKAAVHEYAELGLEALSKIEIEDFSALIVTDDNANDFYAGLMEKYPALSSARELYFESRLPHTYPLDNGCT